jgi:hypothetical protein
VIQLAAGQEAGSGQPVPERIQDVPRSNQRMAKGRIAHLAKTRFPGMRPRVAQEDGKLAAYTARGNLSGYLKSAEGVQPSAEIEPGLATAKDGNMLVQ